MSLKYKSPLIRSRNTAATPPNPNNTPAQNAERSPRLPAANGNSVDSSFDNVLVYDNNPQPSPVTHNWRGRGCSSPRYNSPRHSWGSPYQWTPPKKFNDSWNSDQNYSGSHSPGERNSHSKPQYSKYKKQNTNSWNNESNNESYFHPSMLEDPWAPLLNNSRNIIE